MQQSAKLLIASTLLFSCDGRQAGRPGSAFEPYEEENVTAIGVDEGDRVSVSAPAGAGECVQVSDNLCAPVDTQGAWCEREGGPVDLVLVDGEVVEVVCYPPADNDGAPTREITGSEGEDLTILQTANRTAVTFAPATDGVPIVGDVPVQGNNVSIYGNGPDKTFLDGDVTLEGNNVRLRGVTITGNLYVGLNNAAVVLCRVLGDVVFTSSSTNGSVFVENDVFGTFTADSNGNLLTGNDVSGTWTVSGHSITCDANRGFLDDNADSWVQDDEHTSPLACP